MKDVKLTVSDNYQIKKTIEESLTEENEALLNVLDTIVSTRKTTLGKLSKSEIESKITKKYETDIKELNKVISNNVEEIDRLKNEISSYNNIIESKIAERINTQIKKTEHDLEVRHETELKSLRSKHTDELEYYNSNSSKKIDELKEDHKKRIDELSIYVKELQNRSLQIRSDYERDYQKKLEDEINHYKKSNQSLSDEMIDNLKKSYETRIQSYENQIQQIKQHNETTINTLKLSIELDNKQEKDRIQASISKDFMIKIQDMTEEIARLNSSYQSLKTTKDSELSRINQEYTSLKDNLKTQLTNAEEKVLQQCAEKISMIKQSYEDQLKLVNASSKTTLTHLEERISILNTVNEEQKEQLEEQISRLNDANEEQKEQFNQRISEFQSQIETYKETIKQVSDNRSSIDSIHETIKPIVKFYGGSNENKGHGGEEFIYNNIQSLYDDASLEDVSNTKSKADLFMNLFRLNCLIEIKNKATLKEDDMKKFLRDINVQASSKKINCGWFISLQTNKFPGKKSKHMFCEIDSSSKIPLVYAHITNPTDIKFCVSLLEHMVETSNNSDDKLNTLVTYFNTTYTFIKKHRDNIDLDIRTKQKEITELQKRYAEHDKLFNDMTRDRNKIPSNTSSKPINKDQSDNKIPVNDQDQESENSDLSEPESNQDHVQEPSTESIELITLTKENLSDYQEIIERTILSNMIKRQSVEIETIANILSIDIKSMSVIEDYPQILDKYRSLIINNAIKPDTMKKIYECYKANSDKITKDQAEKILKEHKVSIRTIGEKLSVKNYARYIIEYCVRTVSKNL
jgi:hypothetical protein